MPTTTGVDGKIVYNPDGFAKIIEEKSQGGGSDLDDWPVAPADRQRLVGGVSRGQASHLYHNKATATSSASSNWVNETAAPVTAQLPDYSAHGLGTNGHSTAHSVPITLIFMCFVCKLSFGLAKTLVVHVTGEHGIQLDDEEKWIPSQVNTLAVLLAAGR